MGLDYTVRWPFCDHRKVEDALNHHWRHKLYWALVADGSSEFTNSNNTISTFYNFITRYIKHPSPNKHDIFLLMKDIILECRSSKTQLRLISSQGKEQLNPYCCYSFLKGLAITYIYVYMYIEILWKIFSIPVRKNNVIINLFLNEQLKQLQFIIFVPTFPNWPHSGFPWPIDNPEYFYFKRKQSEIVLHLTGNNFPCTCKLLNFP